MTQPRYNFTHEDTVGVHGARFDHPIFIKYAQKFNILDDFDEPVFYVISQDEKLCVDAVEAARKSLQNGKTFFENAPEYIQKQMIEEQENLERGAIY